jgi:uroporphyrinogen decarboxylase
MKISTKKNQKPLLQAAGGLRPSRYPIWFLRQAGRYLPEYRQVRSGLEFVQMCRSPKDVKEVTLQPLRRYDLDAAIIFSDILVTPIALGQTLTMEKGEGPVLSRPIRTSYDLARLKIPNAAKDLDFVAEAIDRTKEGLLDHQTMIGFAGAPFTVATYMVEGSGTKTFLETYRMIHQSPELFQELLERITAVTIDYLRMQVAAGAEYLMLFDTWAGALEPTQFSMFAQRYVDRIIASLADLGVPICYFPGQGAENLEAAVRGRQTVTHVDWRVPMARAVDRMRESLGLEAVTHQSSITEAISPREVARPLLLNQSPGIHKPIIQKPLIVQGNLNPNSLLGTEASIREATRAVIQGTALADSHIFNIGHGLTPITPPGAVEWVIDEVRKFRP